MTNLKDATVPCCPCLIKHLQQLKQLENSLLHKQMLLPDKLQELRCYPTQTAADKQAFE
ncbi:hypothetical protein BH11BAC3_BH11BAC3_40080 [soil metagenome]